MDTPLDRNSTFEPKVVRKRQRRLKALNEKIIALYARGLSSGDIQAHLAESYGVDVLSGPVDDHADRRLVRAVRARRLIRTARCARTCVRDLPAATLTLMSMLRCRRAGGIKLGAPVDLVVKPRPRRSRMACKWVGSRA
jgi:Transposase, Mutator family